MPSVVDLAGTAAALYAVDQYVARIGAVGRFPGMLMPSAALLLLNQPMVFRYIDPTMYMKLAQSTGGLVDIYTLFAGMGGAAAAIYDRGLDLSTSSLQALAMSVVASMGVYTAVSLVSSTFMAGDDGSSA